MCRIAVADAGGPNVCAFLDLIAWSEIGSKLLAIPECDDGYRVIVGSTPAHPHLMKSYADHPRQLITLSNLGIKSTAAGRYMFLERTWDGIVSFWGSSPRSIAFDPLNQDRACILLLRQCRAYPQIAGGNIEGAIRCAKSTWASLPGAGYGQPEHSMSDLLDVFHARLGRYRADFDNVQAGSATTAPAE